MQGANLAGIVTDQSPASATTDTLIDTLWEHTLRLSRSGYIAPPGFPAMGGHKVFRADIRGGMRAVFRGDHAYYKKHGLYDFPQADYPRCLQTALQSLFLSLLQVQKKAEQRMKQHMIRPVVRAFTECPVLKQRQKR